MGACVCMRVGMHACVHACMGACMHACVCMRVWMHGCVCLLETLMFIRLSSFIEKCCILSPKQFGFSKNHSTYMALVSIVDDISDSLDRGVTQ